MPFEFALNDFSTTTLEDMKQRTVERVQQYAAHLAEYRRQSYNETEVRIDFVNPLFKSLGWDVDNEAGLPQHLREVLLYDGLKLSEREVKLLHSIWNKMRDRRLMRKQSIAD